MRHARRLARKVRGEGGRPKAEQVQAVVTSATSTKVTLEIAGQSVGTWPLQGPQPRTGEKVWCDKIGSDLVVRTGTDSSLEDRVTALEAYHAQTATGSYTGDGTTGRTVSIATGWDPRLVIVAWSDGFGGRLAISSIDGDTSATGVHALSGESSTSALGSNSHSRRPRLVGAGFLVSGNAADLLNHSGRVYTWMALR